MSDRETISLSPALTNTSAEILAGNDRGKYFRDYFKLEQRDLDALEYKVVFPDRVSAISLSFFLGMFGPSILRMGRDIFARKYAFESRPSIALTVEMGIERALKTRQAQAS